MSKARDRILHQMVPNNLHRRVRLMELAAVDRRDADLELEELTDIAPGGDMGAINAGVTWRGDNITINTSTSPATFTGTGEVECWPSIEVEAGVYAVRFTLNNGVVTFYIAASDGRLYAGAGAVVLDDVGATYTGLNYFQNFIATFNSNINYGKIGMFLPALPSGGKYTSYYPPPALQLVCSDTLVPTNIAVNGGFETGDLTGWSTGTSTGSWAVATSPVNGGTYSAVLTADAGESGQLTQSSHVAVSELDSYEISFYVSFQGGTTKWTGTTCTVEIYWYTSGSGLLDVQTYYLPIDSSGAYTQFYKVASAPQDAGLANVIIKLNRTSTGTFEAAVDDFVIGSLGQYSKLALFEDVTLEGGPFVMEELPVGTDGLPKSQGVGNGYVKLLAESDHNLHLIDNPGQQNVLHKGDYAGYAAVVAASTTPTSGYSHTIAAGSMGSHGFFEYDTWWLVSNGTSGSTIVNCTFTISLGGSTLHSSNFGLTTSSTNNRFVLINVKGVITNTGNAATQRAVVNGMGRGSVASGTGTATIAGESGTNTSSVNTGSADRVFDITCALNTASNSSVYRLSALINGPHFANS